MKNPKVLKKEQKISDIEFLSELTFFDKKPKELTNIQLSKNYFFIHQKEKKKTKKIN